jgi:hypothetical protein
MYDLVYIIKKLKYPGQNHPLLKIKVLPRKIRLKYVVKCCGWKKCHKAPNSTKTRVSYQTKVLTCDKAPFSQSIKASRTSKSNFLTTKELEKDAISPESEDDPETTSTASISDEVTDPSSSAASEIEQSSLSAESTSPNTAPLSNTSPLDDATTTDAAENLQKQSSNADQNSSTPSEGSSGDFPPNQTAASVLMTTQLSGTTHIQQNTTYQSSTTTSTTTTTTVLFLIQGVMNPQRLEDKW